LGPFLSRSTGKKKKKREVGSQKTSHGVRIGTKEGGVREGFFRGVSPAPLSRLIVGPIPFQKRKTLARIVREKKEKRGCPDLFFAAFFLRLAVERRTTRGGRGTPELLFPLRVVIVEKLRKEGGGANRKMGYKSNSLYSYPILRREGETLFERGEENG